MKLKPLQKSGYNIVAIVFLVLALSMISIITSITNRNSEQLSVVVSDLSKNKFEIDKIDEAIQLLYKAENNSRLYVLTRRDDLYSEYLNQLNRVSSLIVSIQKDDEEKVNELVEDKRRKTELYIQARLLADSLRKDVSIVIGLDKPPVVEVQNSVQTLQEDSKEKKVIEEFVVEKKSGKGLFGRIKDAIANKPNEKELKSVTTIENKPVVKLEEAIVAAPVAPLQSIVKHVNQSNNLKLSEKERELLFANRILFEELKGLLEGLKQKEAVIQAQRQQSLGNNAALLMDKLKSNYKYNLILSLFLTVVILSVLMLLYRNMRALQTEKQKAVDYAKYKSAFVATLSHEIRTPLHSIHAFTDELSKTNKKEGESEIIDAIKLSSNMLISIVNNILDFTKMERGKFKLSHLPFNPSVVINEVILGLKVQAKRKDLRLISKLGDSADRKIYGDAFQFRQLLVNLIGNAIKYTDQGSVTVIADFVVLDEVTGIIELKIEDTGIGIASDRLSYVFDEFNSQEGIAEIKEGSTGLGLSIVKRIVDYHKGEIKVDSELGKGTSFKVTIPYDVILEDNIEVEKPSKKKQPKILIVENDQLNIKILNLLFKNEEYLFSNSSNGLEALEIYENDDFDLIISDISMPGLNGYELARKIREMPDSKKASVPIIVISGFEAPEDQGREDSDFNAWLVKPFDMNELLSKVKEFSKEGRH